MAGYRWYSTEPGGQPRDGFFVDDQDHVFFWPTKAAPGYVVDAELAAKIKAHLVIGNSKAQASGIGGVIAVMAIALRYIYRNPDVHEQFHSLTHTVSFIPAFLLGGIILVAAILVATTLTRKSRLKDVAVLLQGCPLVHTVRPPAQFLLPSKFASRTRGRRAFGNAVLVVLIAIAFAFGVTSRLPGDPIVTVVFSAALLAAYIKGRGKLKQLGRTREEIEQSVYLRAASG